MTSAGRTSTSARTKVLPSSRCRRRRVERHKNSDFDGFSLRRLDDICYTGFDLRTYYRFIKKFLLPIKNSYGLLNFLALKTNQSVKIQRHYEEINLTNCHATWAIKRLYFSRGIQ